MEFVQTDKKHPPFFTEHRQFFVFRFSDVPIDVRRIFRIPEYFRKILVPGGDVIDSGGVFKIGICT